MHLLPALVRKCGLVMCKCFMILSDNTVHNFFFFNYYYYYYNSQMCARTCIRTPYAWLCVHVRVRVCVRQCVCACTCLAQHFLIQITQSTVQYYLGTAEVRCSSSIRSILLWCPRRIRSYWATPQDAAANLQCTIAKLRNEAAKLWCEVQNKRCPYRPPSGRSIKITAHRNRSQGEVEEEAKWWTKMRNYKVSKSRREEVSS